MMNIKIMSPIPEDEVFMQIRFGSQMYGTQHTDSDKDFVKILKQDSGSLILQFTTRCNMQYDALKLFEKEGHVDYVYTGLENFLAQAKSGANTIFFECMHTPEWNGYMRSVLNEPRGMAPTPFQEQLIQLGYYNPWVAKAYLGLAKRDLPFPGREPHVARCIHFAEKILKRELINLKDVADLPLLPNDLPTIANRIAELRASINYNQESDV